MTTTLLIDNLCAYSLQVLAIVATAAIFLTLARSLTPRARLAVWQAVLALCLLLPLMQSWQPVNPAGSAMVFAQVGPVAVVEDDQPVGLSFDWRGAVLVLLALGAVGRFLWLGVGLYRLRRYRLQAEPMDPTASISELERHVGASAGFYSTGAIRSPVTFGFVRPVVLLPIRFDELDTDVQRAVICHELLHVQRRDWLFTLAEETIRALLWFHPAIWWVLSQIQLTREQVVDREVLAWTQSSEPYVEALMTISGTDVQLDPTPAPLFLRRRHLNLRVESLLQEATISKQGIAVCVVLLAAAVTGATCVATTAFPLSAAAVPQEAVTRPTVGIDEGEPLRHRSTARYPNDARDKRIEGPVALEVAIGENGNVYDAHVISGPAELRAAALQAVLQWHYSEDVPRASKRLVTLNFRLPPERGPRPRPMTDDEVLGTVESITVSGLSEASREALLADLPLEVGDTLSRSLFSVVRAHVDRFDQHLGLAFRAVPGGDRQTKLSMHVSLPRGQMAHGEPMTPRQIRVVGAVAELARRVPPQYPPLARQAGIQGTVVLWATITETGTVEKLEVESGHPLLVPAALEAVKQWEYKITKLNGAAVTVKTQVDIIFRLSR